jgi:uncharacterized protein (TIGR03084 family)
MSDPFSEVLRDHGDEVAALDALLSTLSDDDWLKPTPAEGWDTRDSVAHLAVGDEMALECVLLDRVPEGMQRGMDASVAGGDAIAEFDNELTNRGRELSPSDVLEWWRAGNVALRDALSEMDTSRRLPWGPNVLSPASFVTARLMEQWAHGLDCFDGVGVEPIDTDRLRHIAHLGIRALPYAFMLAGLEAPGPVRLELKAPSGDIWTLGADEAPTLIEGTAGDWCRVAVRRDRRDERSRLSGSGPDADAVITHVRAYL